MWKNHFSNKKNAVIVGVSVLLATPAAAQELPRDWTSLRYAGMGFATVTTSNDSESVFSNPAGLARMRNPRSRRKVHEVHFPRVSISAPEGQLQPVGNTLFTAADKTLPTILQNISSETGNHETLVQTNAFPSIVMGGKSKPTFLFGTYGSSQVIVKRETTDDPGFFDITRDTTVGLALGIANVSRAGTIAYGLSVRPNARYYERLMDYSLSENPNYSGTQGITQLDRTIGVGLDAGLLFTAADFWLPTFGLAIRNAPTGCVDNVFNPYSKQTTRVCGSRRQGATQEGETRTLLDAAELVAGLSITPRFRMGRDRLNIRLSGEASPLAFTTGGAEYGFTEVPLEQVIKAGLEVFFGHPLIFSGVAARGGIFNSELTWGASIELSFLAIEYASYVRQTTFADETTGKVRQHMAGFSTRW